MIIWGLGGPEEDHQLHHCCWTGRVGEREEEERSRLLKFTIVQVQTWTNIHFNRSIIEFRISQAHNIAYLNCIPPRTVFNCPFDFLSIKLQTFKQLCSVVDISNDTVYLHHCTTCFNCL